MLIVKLIEKSITIKNVKINDSFAIIIIGVKTPKLKLEISDVRFLSKIDELFFRVSVYAVTYNF